MPARPGVCLALAGALVGCNASDERKPAPPPENSTQATAMQTVTSKDGTRIAYDKQGNGPPLIVVGGALADRSAGADYARLLSPHFTVYTFDGADAAIARHQALCGGARDRDIAALIDQPAARRTCLASPSGPRCRSRRRRRLAAKSKSSPSTKRRCEADGAAANGKATGPSRPSCSARAAGANAVVHLSRSSGCRIRRYGS